MLSPVRGASPGQGAGSAQEWLRGPCHGGGTAQAGTAWVSHLGTPCSARGWEPPWLRVPGALWWLWGTGTSSPCPLCLALALPMSEWSVPGSARPCRTQEQDFGAQGAGWDPDPGLRPCPGLPEAAASHCAENWGWQLCHLPGCCPLEPGRAPGTTRIFWHDVPSLPVPPPALLLTGAVPVSLLSAGHTDDFQRSQGAGTAFQAEGEGCGAGLGVSELKVRVWGAGIALCSRVGATATAARTPALPPSCWAGLGWGQQGPGAVLRAGFVPPRITWCVRKPRA